MIKSILIAIVGLSIMGSFAFAVETPTDKKSCMMMLGGLDPILDSKKIPKETAKSLFGQLEGISVKCQSGQFSEAAASIANLKEVLDKLENK